MVSELGQTDIQVPFPSADNLQLRITVGACRMKIAPADIGDWVSGQYLDPTGSVPLNVEAGGSTARISQTYNWPESWGIIDRPPELELKLGRSKPYSLTLETGASEGVIDLGGLPLTRLSVKEGAGKHTIDFSTANPQPMSVMSVGAGAAGLELRHLSNANFADLSLEGGAAAYTLDFGGQLRRDARVRIGTGMSSVDIRVPATTAAKISTETVLGGVDVGDGFMKREGAFWTEGALSGNLPVLTIHVTVAMGSIRLRTA